jgi:hypothetical protein
MVRQMAGRLLVAFFQNRLQRMQSQPVRAAAKPHDLAGAGCRQDGLVAKLLPGVDVGQVQFDPQVLYWSDRIP